MKLLIFTYAPAGLGHLRVTDALVDSRPMNVPYLMLGSYDRFITKIHRFTSVNPLGRGIFTFFQNRFMDDFATTTYRSLLLSSSSKVYQQLFEIISSRSDIDEVVIIASHFGMAHQIGKVKERLQKATGKIVRLIVQITDDTTQHIWCVRGADLTFVPSERAKISHESYARRNKMGLKFEVIPYPISPILTEKLPSSSARRKTFKGDSEPVNVVIPVSGAAVGLLYHSRFIHDIVKLSSRVKIWVVIKKSIYTEMFLSSIADMPNVEVVAGRNDNEMIHLYEQVYKKNVIHLEITKPSEQAFKAILPPDTVGGSILLFTSPVGRQEYENLDFLKRHLLVGSEIGKEGMAPTEHLRAIRLSSDPLLAAKFVNWAIDSQLFLKMNAENYKFSTDSIKSGEVGTKGASEFWKTLEKYFG